MRFNLPGLLCIAFILAFAASCDPVLVPDDDGTNNGNNNNNNGNNNGNNGGNNNGNNGGNNNGSNTEAKDEATPADILTSAKYKSLVIEIAQGPGTNISSPSVALRPSLIRFYNFVTARVNKVDTVILRRTAKPLPSTPAVMDNDALADLAQINRKQYTQGDTLYVWIAVINSVSSDNPEPDIVLGQQIGGSSFVIFEKELNKLTLPDMVSRFTLEAFILEHDFGHLMGLTNNGVPMATPHEDADHGSHCSNAECLMYWKADENMFLADLLGGNNAGTIDVIPILDANCIADLQASGGK